MDFEALRPAFSATGGLLLSQVCDVTGVGAATVQNWVKRGWVTPPVDKRYGEFQVARILVIDTLRSALSLEMIASLMSFVNGRVDDRSDDIIDDSKLYVLIHRGISLLNENGALLSEESVDSVVEQITSEYNAPSPDAHTKLCQALRVMLLGYLASKLKLSAENAYNQLFND